MPTIEDSVHFSMPTIVWRSPGKWPEIEISLKSIFECFYLKLRWEQKNGLCRTGSSIIDFQ